MTADDVVTFLALMEAAAVRVWLDGGWAVDAVLGHQTRRHDDLDVVIEARDLSRAEAALRGRGYVDVPRDDTRAWNFVLGDAAGHLIDFHVIEVDANGNGTYGPDGVFPAESLTATGTIAGRSVSCISPEWLVRFHTGYRFDDKDRADVMALCERFGIALPAEYAAGAEPPVVYQVRRVVDDAVLSRLHSAASGSADAQTTPWSSRLARHSVTWVCAFSEGQLIGFVNAVGDGGVHAFLVDTVVHPDWQRHGVGSALVRRAVDACARGGCGWLHVDYEPHLAGFYVDRCGFGPTSAGLMRL